MIFSVITFIRQNLATRGLLTLILHTSWAKAEKETYGNSPLVYTILIDFDVKLHGIDIVIVKVQAKLVQNSS